MQQDKTILSVRRLTTQLKIGKEVVTVVDNLSFDLRAGETLSLVGESGCGKSMTALSLMRILPEGVALPPQGEVLYKGQNLLTLPERKMRALRGSKLAMIFQDPMSSLNPVMTIGAQLMEVAELHLRLDPEAARARAIDALHSVGLASPEQRLSDYPHQLSGGMKQRVMIAMALLCEPDLLIADEPTTALDVTVQAQVLELIRTLQQERGTALLLITHDMGVVAEMADEVIVMYAARSMERAPVTTLFDHHAHPYTQGLFSSRLSKKSAHGPLVVIPGSVPRLGHFPAGCPFHPRCGHATERCRKGDVPRVTLSEGHELACWLHDTQGGIT